MTITRALISVSDKRNLGPFAGALAEMGIEILSTGGTARVLGENGISVTEVSKHTGFPEIMDGRVKTLHPKIHGGILGVRSNDKHVAAMDKHDLPPIDLVAVNLYPFQQTIANPDATWDDAIENIDIGGPAMVRSAAKNHESVVVIVDPSDYDIVLAELSESGQVSLETRTSLAAKAIFHTACYDQAISEYLSDGLYSSLTGTRVVECKGENGSQSPAGLRDTGGDDPLALSRF